MSEITTTAPRATPIIPSGIRIAFYMLGIGLALMHAFISFRGLRSEAGMDQAQAARQLVRTGEFATQVIPPYAWAQLESHGSAPDAHAFPSTFSPPLPSLINAALFLPFRQWWDYQPSTGSSIYLLDRVVACFGVLLLLGTIYLTHGTARVVFDEKVAAVAAASLMVSGPLWDLAVSGSPVVIVFFEVALAVRLWVGARQRLEDDEPAGASMLAIGLILAAMVMTHWMAIWLVLALVAATVFFMPVRRWNALMLAAFPLAILAAWGWRNLQITGDMLGAAKAFFQFLIIGGQPEDLLRDFSMNTPGVQVDLLVRGTGIHWQSQLGRWIVLSGSVIPALVGLAAFLHPFKRTVASDTRWMTAIMLTGAVVAGGLMGLSEDASDDNNLYITLTPLLAVLGSAMLVIWWGRLFATSRTFWGEWGFAVLAISLSALPLAVRLPSQLKIGITLAGRQFPHWPPYVPDRVEVVGRLLDENEVVFSDAPWFVAWYADVPTVWIPRTRTGFYDLREKLATAGSPAAGVVVTPVSARQTYVGDLFTGSYADWPDLILRGPMLAFDKAFLPDPDFPYKVPLPLVAFPIGESESLGIFMAFYTDRPRLPETPAE